MRTNTTVGPAKGRAEPIAGFRLGFVLDYIPDGVIVSKDVLLSRDSYTDRWLGALHNAGVSVTKYVPWADAQAVETHLHRFGHRVKLVPVRHRLVLSGSSRGTGRPPLYQIDLFGFTLNLLRELRKDRVQLVHYANYFTGMFVFSPLVSLVAPTVTWFTGGDVPKSSWGRWTWFLGLRPAFHRVRGVMIGNYPERRKTLLWLMKGDGRKVRPFQLLRVDQKVFRPGDKSEARRGLGYDESSLQILSVMSVIPLPHEDPENRQPFTMLRILSEAFKTVQGRRASMTVIGTGPGLARLKDLAAELGIAERVRFEGRVEHDRLSDYYAAADLVFVPYRMEALNETNVLAEAFSCGRAAVAFRRSGGAGEEAGGFLISPDLPTGANELARILLEPEDWSKKSAEALALSPQFSLDNAATDLLSAYDDLLSA